MARPQTHGKVIGTFSGVFYEEDRATMDGLERVRRKTGRVRSELIKDAIREYVKRK
jgi:hypothetical protein